MMNLGNPELGPVERMLQRTQETKLTIDEVNLLVSISEIGLDTLRKQHKQLTPTPASEKVFDTVISKTEAAVVKLYEIVREETGNE